MPWTPLTLGSSKICGNGSGAGVGATYWMRLTTSVAAAPVWSAEAERVTPLASSAEPQNRLRRSGWDMPFDETLLIITFPPLTTIRP